MNMAHKVNTQPLDYAPPVRRVILTRRQRIAARLPSMWLAAEVFAWIVIGCTLAGLAWMGTR